MKKKQYEKYNNKIGIDNLRWAFYHSEIKKLLVNNTLKRSQEVNNYAKLLYQLI